MLGIAPCPPGNVYGNIVEWKISTHALSMCVTFLTEFEGKMQLLSVSSKSRVPHASAVLLKKFATVGGAKAAKKWWLNVTGSVPPMANTRRLGTVGVFLLLLLFFRVLDHHWAIRQWTIKKAQMLGGEGGGLPKWGWGMTTLELTHDATHIFWEGVGGWKSFRQDFICCCLHVYIHNVLSLI